MRATWTAAALTAALALTPVASAAAAVPRPGADTPQPATAAALPMDQPVSAVPTRPVTAPVTQGNTQSPLAPQTAPAAPADDGGGGLVSVVTGLVKTLQNVLSGLLGNLSSAKPPAATSALNDQATTSQLVPPATLAELLKTVDALKAAETAAAQ
ncbi:hypothetical protein [Streptomyces sp. YS-3]|uniref:hypothetical protein n=1 Tax=Streptomyces sp. YS-3 TaxID=3381352 RepID=UPI0038628BB3